MVARKTGWLSKACQKYGAVDGPLHTRGQLSQGRLYLGMHSPLDVIVGARMGAVILLFWCLTEKSLDAFITHGENVPSFWAAIAVLLLFAYPSPERRNPSFEFHTVFNGVAFGVVAAVHRTYALFHRDGVQGLPLTSIVGVQTLLPRLLLGLPLCLAVKAVAKELAVRILPSMCNLLGLQIRSTAYVKAIHMDEFSLKEKTKSEGGMDRRQWIVGDRDTF